MKLNKVERRITATDAAGYAHETQVGLVYGYNANTGGGAAARGVFCNEHGFLKWVMFSNGVDIAIKHLKDDHGAVYRVQTQDRRSSGCLGTLILVLALAGALGHVGANLIG